MSEEITNVEENANEPIVLGGRSEEVVQCAGCGKELKVEERHAFEGEDGQDVYYCDECMHQINQELDQMTKNLNIPKAILFSLVTAVVCGILYGLSIALTKTDFAIIAIGVGYLVALAACKGAGDKRGMKLQIMSVLFTLGAIFIANDVFLYFASPDFHSLSGIISLLIAGPIVAITAAGPIGLAIWAFALYAAYTVPKAPKL